MTFKAQFSIRKDAFALDVDFDVPIRGITALFGPSGSGKTLTLRVLAGLERAPNGLIQFGQAVWQDDRHWTPTHERGVGFVFQEASLFAHLDVRGNLNYARKRCPVDRPAPDLNAVRDLLGISHLLDRRAAALSGGERQRVAIARALLSGPSVLLMDEPLASLDEMGKEEILPCIERLRDETDVPIVYVSHATDEVAQLADHMILLNEGRVRSAGAIQSMLTRLDLPLAHGRDAESVVDAVVAEPGEEDGIGRLEFPGGSFYTPGANLKPGQRVRVRLRAAEVSLSLERHADTSILNILPATVVEIAPSGPQRMTALLNVGGTPLLARVTTFSAERLALKPGMHVFAQVKGVALMAT